MACDGPIIHIGFPRCASTFLQQEIFPRIPSFKVITACPETRRLFVTTYYHNLPKDFLFFRLGRSRYIYSNEGLLQYCHHWSGGQLESYEREIGISNITRIFRDYGDILIVIRRQDDIIESEFRSSAARYFGKPENIFLDFPLKKVGDNFKLLTSIGHIYTESFDYYKWIMRITNQLGKERVHILVYEDLVYDPKRFFQRLSSILGEDIMQLMQYKEERRNVSPRKSLILPSYIRPIEHFRKYMPSGLVSLKRIFNKQISLGDANKLKLLNQFKQGNKLLSSEFNLDLDRYGYF